MKFTQKVSSSNHPPSDAAPHNETTAAASVAVTTHAAGHGIAGGWDCTRKQGNWTMRRDMNPVNQQEGERYAKDMEAASSSSRWVLTDLKSGSSLSKGRSPLPQALPGNHASPIRKMSPHMTNSISSIANNLPGTRKSGRQLIAMVSHVPPVMFFIEMYEKYQRHKDQATRQKVTEKELQRLNRKIVSLIKI
jgi:hypothetical protein